jgi:general secretion pathway protein F
MPVFEYTALNTTGKKVSGLVTADGPAAARLKLGQSQIFVTGIKEVKTTGRRSAAAAIFSHLPGVRRINPVEVTTAMRQLATLVSSGLPHLDCLNGLIEQTERPQLKSVFTQIREKVVEGGSLSHAMAEHPGIFSQIHVNMVRAGETGGALDIILQRLADFSERRMRLKRKIEAAMAYPLFLLLISSVIIIFLMSFVMPKVVGIFEGMELALPWSTRALIAITHFMKRFWWLVLGGAGIGFGAISAWTKTDRGSRSWDRFRLWVPFLGKLHHKAVIARFTRTLSTMLKSGIPLVSSLEISRLSMGNRIMEDTVRETARQVGEGEDFAAPLRRAGRFPPLMIQLIRAGEQSGDLEGMLSKAADVYEDEVEATITSLTSIIEPAIIIVMGFTVGFMVMAILLPIFDMTGGIR